MSYFEKFLKSKHADLHGAAHLPQTKTHVAIVTYGLVAFCACAWLALGDALFCGTGGRVTMILFVRWSFQSSNLGHTWLLSYTIQIVASRTQQWCQTA